MDVLPEDYTQVLAELKGQISGAQLRAAAAVNATLVDLYWQVGRTLSARISGGRGASKIITQLAKDLRREFPAMRGLSSRNMRYMREFAEAYPDDGTWPQLVARIPWGHNRVILDRHKEPQARMFYIQKTIEHGWSRAVLELQIDAQLYEREGRAVTNFARTLPAEQSDLAQEIMRDPYHLDFLAIGGDAREREIENALVEHIRRFLLELGAGFAFMGSQYPVTIAGDEYRLDLLFYHVKLRCYGERSAKAT